MTAPSPPPSGPPSPLATRLADLYTALALAVDEAAMLAAIARHLAPLGVGELLLAHLVGDDRGRPRDAEIVAQWPTPAPVRRFPASELPLAHLWLRTPDEPHWISDLDADPRLDPATRERLAAVRSLVAVPLRDERLGAWQGALFLHWTAPFTRTPEAEFLVRALVRAVTSAVTARRTLHAHADALAETSTLYTASAALNQADSLPALLAVLGTAAATHGATGAWLFTVDDGPDGRPAALVLRAAWPDEAALGTPGAHYPVGSLPLIDVWLRDGLVPAYFTDLGDDRRIDPATRAVAERVGIRSFVALPLAWRGRWTAIVVLGWPQPHAARPGEQRLYTAVARQAAVVLDNRLLLEQAQRALDEHSRQRSTLSTLLETLPVGVFVNEAETGETVLINRAGRALTHDLAETGVFHPGTDSPIPQEEWTIARAIRSGRTVPAEVDFLHRDGRRTGIDTVSGPIFDERGRVARVVSVFRDVSERRLADAERTRMQDDLVRLQAAALAERSTPLIPVSDEILVVPIVGTVDPGRGHQILETVVELGGRTRVRAAILDLTGVRDLDAAAGETLLGAAQALRLRGVLTLLTGIQADAAVALTALGQDLRGLIVCADLQSAIQRATAAIRRPVPEDSTQVQP